MILHNTSMQKPLVMGIGTFGVLAVLLYIVFSTTNIKLFSGTECVVWQKGKPAECSSELISYRDHKRGQDMYGAVEMTGGGWAVFLLLTLGLPAIAGALMYKKALKA